MGCVTTSGHVPSGHGAKSKDAPSRSILYYCTTICYRVIPFFDSLKKECFSLPALPYFVLSAELWVVVFFSFVFECPHLYWARKMFSLVPDKLIMISKYDFIKAAPGLCP